MKARAVSAAGRELEALRRLTLFSLLVVAVYMVMAASAYAGNPADTPMAEVLCEIIAWLQGNLGRGLCSIAIGILGIGACLGKITWGMAVTVGVGISVLYNAEEIVELLGLGTSVCP